MRGRESWVTKVSLISTPYTYIGRRNKSNRCREKKMKFGFTSGAIEDYVGGGGEDLETRVRKSKKRYWLVLESNPDG